MKTLEAPASTQIEAPIAVLEPAPKFDLGRWRRERLGRLKRTTEYQQLPKPCRDLVDYMVRSHDHPSGGMFPSQGGVQKGRRKPLATARGVSRKTISKYLGLIVDAEVFDPPTFRYRGLGTRGGRTSNVYRLNERLLLPSQKTEGYITGDSTGYSGSTDVHVEVPTGQVEALSEQYARDEVLTPGWGFEDDVVYSEDSTSITKHSVENRKENYQRDHLRSLYPAHVPTEMIASLIRNGITPEQCPDPSAVWAEIEVQQRELNNKSEGVPLVNAGTPEW